MRHNNLVLWLGGCGRALGACGGAGSRNSEVAAWRQLGSTGPEKDAEARERDR